MTDAKSYWDARYRETPFSSGKAPSPLLSRMWQKLEKGKCLDIGMGEGINAVYLAQKGFQVKGFDISQVAIDHALKLAKETGVEIEANQADLDLFLMGLMEYETIVMFDFKPGIVRYYTEIIRALKQGGTLLIEGQTTEDMKEVIRPGEEFRDHYYKSNELLRNLQGMQVIYYSEMEDVDRPGRHYVQCLARKPLDKDAVKYGLFDMHANKQSNKQSNQLKLAEQLFKK